MVKFSLKIKTEPTVEPVNISELKSFGRIDSSDEDALLVTFIKTARKNAEEYTRRAFITQTWELILDAWGNTSEPGIVELTNSPLQSIVEIRTLDTDGTPTTISADNYYLETRAEPGIIYARESISGTRETRNIEIEYICGYGNTPSTIPPPIKTAISLWALELYETRIPTTEPPIEAKKILFPYRVLSL